MFFTKHNKITIPDNDSLKVITDISSTINISENIKNTNLCFPYNIQDGDSPESISNSVYDSQVFSWVILLINGIKNIHTDWPLSSVSFENYFKSKYDGTSTLFLKLDSIKTYNIKKGDMICISGSQEDSAEVIEWDASLSKLVIKASDHKFEKNNKIALLSSNAEIGIIGRVVNYSVHALHHFESQGQYIDPLLGNLKSYVHDGSNENVVTVYDYELMVNDKKRKIFIVKNDYLKTILKDYNNVMRI